nr:MAG TPA: hypothetical protein [Caudoviricetes sp.]
MLSNALPTFFDIKTVFYIHLPFLIHLTFCWYGTYYITKKQIKKAAEKHSSSGFLYLFGFILLFDNLVYIHAAPSRKYTLHNGRKQRQHDTLPASNGRCRHYPQSRQSNAYSAQRDGDILVLNSLRVFQRHAQKVEHNGQHRKLRFDVVDNLFHMFLLRYFCSKSVMRFS